MSNNPKKNKYVFLGDIDSVNIEIIIKSHKFLKDKVNYILIGNKSELIAYMKRLKSNIRLNEVIDPINFINYKKNQINIFNVDRFYKEKYKNLLNQIKISNKLSNITKFDLITMPINKSIIKKKTKFIGMTEYLGKINNCETFMLMFGEKFSVIPLTTHINLKNVYKVINSNYINMKISKLLTLIELKKYKLKFNSIIFLCYNPHCSENITIGLEDNTISNILSKNFKKILGPYPADSAFTNYKNNSLFISTYHDQALIPFKLVNKKGYNLTLGLNYRRLSPAHGTAKNLKFKNKSNNSSYIACMLS